MTVIASDDFAGTAGTELSAYNSAWSQHTGATGNAQITAAGRLRASSTTLARYVHSASPSSADYAVSADVHVASTSGAPRALVVGRADPAAQTYYSWGLHETSGSIDGMTLTRTVAGTATQLGRDTTNAYSAPNTCLLDMAGTTIRGVWNGTELFSVTDSGITAAGKGGVMFINTSGPSDSTTYHLDNWVMEEAGGGGTDLAVNDASHGHSADSLTLSIGVSLAINDATHGHAADALTLTTSSTLAVADATHAHAADQVTLTLAGSESLTIADATHAHTADAPVLSVDSLLAVDDALHAHSADNVVLGVSGAADLVIADATHAHSVDGLVLTAESLLAIQDALHAHAADELTLNTAPTLLIAEALHAHASDGLALTVNAWLVIADARHAHAADVVALTVAGGDLSASPGYTITGRLRAIEVRGRTRRFEVDQ